MPEIIKLKTSPYVILPKKDISLYDINGTVVRLKRLYLMYASRCTNESIFIFNSNYMFDVDEDFAKTYLDVQKPSTTDGWKSCLINLKRTYPNFEIKY